MKFLMLSVCGEGAGLLHRIQEEGNDVQLYIQESSYKNAWDNLIPKVKKIDPDPNTIVICDFSGMGRIADKLKKSGIKVVGGSSWADRMEQDRQFGLEAMERSGILIPRGFEGKSLSDVEAILGEYGKDGKRWYFKPSGKKGLPSHLTYCGLDDADLLEYVKYVEKNFGGEVESFVLQERIEGVCVSTEAWFDGEKFIRPTDHTVEVKGFMDHDLGQATGCSGNLVWAELGDCRIAREGVLKLEEYAAESGYIGSIDLNTIVNEDGCYGLEWCCRFGLDATPTLLALFKDGEVGKFFSDLAKGQVSHGVPILADKVAAGVRLTIPPYPIEADPDALRKIAPNLGIPIRGISEKDVDNFYFYEVMETEEGDLVHSSGTGVIACVTSVADRPEHALDKIYDLLDCVKIPDKQYRTDLEHCLCKMYEEVEEQDVVSVSREE